MPLFEPPSLRAEDHDVIELTYDLRRRLKFHVAEPRRWSGLLRRVSLARAIRGSNSIEGFVVSLEDAFAALDEKEPLEADAAAWAAVRGYRNAMTYVLQLAREEIFDLSVDTIKALHFMLQSYDLSKWPGRARSGDVYVYDEDRETLVYTGPDSERVPALLNEFIRGLQESRESGLPALVTAAMAHLNLVMIHPFKDGNGRIARCVQSLLLARDGTTAPEFSSIEEYLGRNEEQYYNVLSVVGQGSWNPGNDTRPWVRFCLTAHYRQALTVQRRSKESERLWLIAEQEIQRAGLPDRCVDAMFYTLGGRRLRNSAYRQVTEVSQGLASKDLGELVKSDLLRPVGEKRGRYYIPAHRLLTSSLAVRREIAQKHPLDADPYEIVRNSQPARGALWNENS
jgi:Fic family protein